MLETGKQHKIVTNLTDDKFSEVDCHRYSLQIVLNGEYFAFSINNKQGKLLRVVEICLDNNDWVNSIYFALQEFPSLDNQYKSVTVKYQSFKHTFIPEEFYSEETKKSFLHLNCGIEPNEIILSDHLTLHKTHLAYLVPEQIYVTLKDWFPNAEFSHSATPFIQHLFDISETSKTEVYCNVNISNFELVVFKKGKLELYNHFQFTNEEDFIYYLLYAYEQLLLNTETIPTYFTGKVANPSPIFDVTYRYLRNVAMLPFQISTLQGELIEDYNCTEFYNILV